jgi:hypothetical protein
MSETRPHRILRCLAREVLSTSQIVDELAEGIEPRGQALSWYGSILRDQEQAGRVEQAGKVRSGRYNGAPTCTWRITDEGRKLLAYLDDAPLREAERERLEAEMAETASRRAEALAEGARIYSRGTPRAERWHAAVRLRRLGCTLEEIGELFGVTREMIRKELLLTEEPPSRPMKGGRPRLPRSGLVNLTARQAKYLVEMHQGKSSRNGYSYFIATGRALEARGLVEFSPSRRLTDKGRRVAALLAEESPDAPDA